MIWSFQLVNENTITIEICLNKLVNCVFHAIHKQTKYLHSCLINYKRREMITAFSYHVHTTRDKPNTHGHF